MLTVPGDWTNCKETNEGRPKIILSFCRIPTAQWLNRLETSKNKLTDSPKIPTILILSTNNSKGDCFIFLSEDIEDDRVSSCTVHCWTKPQLEAGSGSGKRMLDVSDVQPRSGDQRPPQAASKASSQLPTLRLETVKTGQWRLVSGLQSLSASSSLDQWEDRTGVTWSGWTNQRPVSGHCLHHPGSGEISWSSPDGTQLHGRGQRLGLGE